MSDFSITVGIPTFNRPEALLRRLNELIHFSDQIKKVIVCDNSDLPHEAARQICVAQPGWHYEKNPYNIGFGPNFLKAISLSEGTSHFWVRGDDDPITSSQLDTVLLSQLKKDEFLILDSSAGTPFLGSGLEDFCRHFRRVQVMSWVSMLIIPCELAKQALTTGYWGVSTGFPHFSLVIGMFLKNPQLKFRVTPFVFSISEFRDVDEKSGQRWAFFNLCIKGFSRTAETIPDPRLRRIYIREWRNSQSLRNVKKIVAMKIGTIRSEPISFSTLSPLLSIDNINRVPLFAILYLSSKIPRGLFQIAVALWSGTQSKAQLKKLNLTMLQPDQSFSQRLANLRKISPEKIITAVY